MDIRDRAALGALLRCEQPEVVFHLAAQMNVRRSIADPLLDAEVNILGTLNVLQSSCSSKVRRVVFASSGGAVYGEQPRYPCIEEDRPRPSSPYGIAKLTGEEYGRHFASETGLEFTSLRLANVYGPRQHPEGEAGVIAIFLDAMKRGQSPSVFGDGEQTRDFIWVGDVVQAFLASLVAPAGTYNVGTGRETSINELFLKLSKVAQFSGGIRRKPTIPAEVRRNILGIQRSGEILAWRPTRSLEEGLRETWQATLGEQFPVSSRIEGPSL